MTEKSKNLIKEEMLSLPKEAQDAIDSLDWGKITEEIGKKYLLDEDEIETFQLETASFLLGLIDEDSYPINIEEEIGTSKEEAKKIATEVFEKIVTPISNLIDENIKKNLKNKNPSPEQTLNFILSGGDYTSFITQSSPQENLTPPLAPLSLVRRGDGGEVNPTPPTLADIKSQFKI